MSVHLMEEYRRLSVSLDITKVGGFVAWPAAGSSTSRLWGDVCPLQGQQCHYILQRQIRSFSVRTPDKSSSRPHTSPGPDGLPPGVYAMPVNVSWTQWLTAWRWAVPRLRRACWVSKVMGCVCMGWCGGSAIRPWWMLGVYVNRETVPLSGPSLGTTRETWK